MTDAEATYEDFIASRRSGRRNAIHEILADAEGKGTADLSQSLATLSINKPGDKGEDAEKTQDSAAKDEEGSQGGGS